MQFVGKTLFDYAYPFKSIFKAGIDLNIVREINSNIHQISFETTFHRKYTYLLYNNIL